MRRIKENCTIRLIEVEHRIAELQKMQRSLQQLNDGCCEAAHSSVNCSILETLENGAQRINTAHE